MTDERRHDRYFITTAIPYVNARPHVGFAMELVLADVQARYRRLRGCDVRFLTGTDENSLKNVQAAEAQGLRTEILVEHNARAFRALRESLELSFDDFIRTSADPRHGAGVEKLWQACAGRGDIYKRAYHGLYCIGCEQFYAESDLVEGRCPEHLTRPELVKEENYFFRLSRYQSKIEALLGSGELRVIPEGYRKEMLALVTSGLEDFSISRSSARARGWGIPVPGDPDQVMYVWFDALGNYITALDYATDGDLCRRYWAGNADITHVIGKGITRFHAVYWPAMLLSAGLPVPTTIAVHGYVTVEGQKIGKSLGNAIDPDHVVGVHGADVIRYFLCRHIRSGRDGDFSAAAVDRARDSELADQLGNLLKRTINMIERYHDGCVPAPGTGTGTFESQAVDVARRYERAFDDFRLDDALAAAWSLVEAANRYVVQQTPWRLAKRRPNAEAEARLAETLYDLAEILRLSAIFVAPFMPRSATEIRRQLGLAEDPIGGWTRATRWGGLEPGTRVCSGESLFPKPAR